MLPVTFSRVGGPGYCSLTPPGSVTEAQGQRPVFYNRGCSLRKEFAHQLAPFAGGIPDVTRNENGDLVHDSLLISAALASVLDGQVWGTAQSELIYPLDPLTEMEPVF